MSAPRPARRWEDPYQHEFNPYDHEDWYRHQAAEVQARTACEQCAGSVPESDDYSWKYAQAGGLLAGPFCSSGCYWDWLAGGDEP